jgi:hypothetical protein
MNAFETASMLMLPYGRKPGKIISIKPTNDNGDLTIDRNCPAFEINKEGKLELVAANVPRFNHPELGSCPKLLQEPEIEQLLGNPNSIGHSDYSKVNSKIHADTANVDTIQYESDFSAGNDGWSGNAASRDGNIDGISDGATSFDDCFRITLTTGNVKHYAHKESVFVDGDITNLEFWIYIPSTNSLVDGFTVSNDLYGFDGWNKNGAGANFGNIWTKVDIVNINANGRLYFVPLNGNSDIVDADGDVIYIKAVKISKLKGYSSPSTDFPYHSHKIVDSGVNGSHGFNRNISFPNGIYNTVLVVAKKEELSWLHIAISGDGNIDAYFDLENGELGTITSGTAKIIEIADGYFLCWAQGLSTGTSGAIWVKLATDDLSDSFAGNGSDGVNIFLINLFQTNLFTLPIFDGVEGASVTRLADNSNMSDLQTSNLLGASEGTWIIHFGEANFAVDGEQYIWLTANNSINSVIRLLSLINGNLKLNVINASPTSEVVQEIAVQVANSKVLVKWKNDAITLIANGVKYIDSIPITIYPYDLHNTYNGNQSFNIQKQLMIPIAISDADGIALTS